MNKRTLPKLIAAALIVCCASVATAETPPFVPPRGVPTPDVARAARNPYYGLRSSYSSIRDYYRAPPTCPPPQVQPRRPVYYPQRYPVNPYGFGFGYPYQFGGYPYFRR